LLLAINLFNYIDRQVLSAVLPRLQLDGTIIHPNDPDAQFKLGLLTSAFMVSYMLFSPIFGWLDGRGARRWLILGIGVTLWSLASGFSGFATGYAMLLATRCLVGIGEAAYGPVASAMLADAYPVSRRGAVMAIFNMAIPIGSALGFAIGGLISMLTGDWRPAFWFTFTGLIIGAVCFFRKELPRPVTVTPETAQSYWQVLRTLTRIRSFVLCCAGMTAITFVLGGVAAWVSPYFFQREARFEVTPAALTKLDEELPAEVTARLRPLADGTIRTYPEMKNAVVGALGDDARQYSERVFLATATESSPNPGTLSIIFGGILFVCGLAATAFGAWLGEKLRRRGIRGAYFLVIGGGALFAVPSFLGILYTPLPWSWFFVFLTIFGLFLHTGPAFTALANVTSSQIRATAFAINILVIHALGDMISPTLIGFVADRSNLQFAFLLTTTMIALGAILWLAGAKYLDEDTRRAESQVSAPSPAT
jgi:MFS family permease